MTEVGGEDLTSGVSNSSRAHHEGVHHTGGMVGLNTSRAGEKCQQEPRNGSISHLERAWSWHGRAQWREGS